MEMEHDHQPGVPTPVFLAIFFGGPLLAMGLAALGGWLGIIGASVVIGLMVLAAFRWPA
ncbi:hypothetical protein ACQEVF_07320 [Nonomuraea polychroma]|uniref:hypothetical protein n=1 Tax=Nonomuraea polychroma TaxID=46176 RepID=UPI003D914810